MLPCDLWKKNIFKPNFINKNHLTQRSKFLQTLIIEYEEKKDINNKEQILANLANFSYDPLNFEIMRQLNIIDLFLDNLDEPHEKIVQYSLSGLSNLSFDALNCQTIVKNDGINLIQFCLDSTNEEILTSALSIFISIYILFKSSVAKDQTITLINNKIPKSNNPRISNLMSILNNNILNVAKICS